MAQKKKFKWDIRKIVLAILLVAVVVGVATGKISLSQLLGINVQTQQAAQSGEIPAETKASQPETQASGGEVVTLVPVQSADRPSSAAATEKQTVEYKFRNKDRLDEHYEKHGAEMGFASAEEYLAAANKVLDNPNVLHKKEKEDDDEVYYLEETNEFVVVSDDGYIRTYFYPSAGIDYYNRQ